MSCVLIAGIFFIGGEDWNGSRYLLNIDSITYIEEMTGVYDDDQRPRTLIHTTGGMLVEDLNVLDVAVNISSCEAYYIMQPEGEEEQ